MINLVFNPIEKNKSRRFDRKHPNFLKRYEGQNILCYKNKEIAENYIQKNVKPYLPDNIIYLNLNDKDLPIEYEPLDLKTFMNQKEFPFLMKIRNLNMKSKPMYNQFYKSMFIAKSNEELVNEIKEFFEIN